MRTSIWWLRRDLRLDDNPALDTAIGDGNVVPAYIDAPDEEAPWVPGAASRVWLRRSLAQFGAVLQARGSGLVLRRGPSLEALLRLVAETGATSVHWNRLYEPAIAARDAVVERELRKRGVAVRIHEAALLFAPDALRTAAGAPYRVFTPYWRRLRSRLDGLPAPRPAPACLPPLPELAGESLDTLVPAPRPAWDRGFRDAWEPGEGGAQTLFEAFLDGALRGYGMQRDRPDRIGTSRLSPHLHFGEISPRRISQRLLARQRPAALEADSEAWLRELGWREFSYQLLHHFPASSEANLDPRFDGFGWAAPDPVVLEAWQRGRTGVPIIDAGMRELWTTGWMHNRVRMLVASFLTRHLRQHWLHGARWFWDTLVDADLANNTQGWQWCAGTGADAAPYFRIFNPVTQARRFDPQGRYVRRWVPELAALPEAAIHAPWEHPALARELAPAYPAAPVVDLAAGRAAALEAYHRMREPMPPARAS